MNILMVCLGNICRSPMADGLLRKKFQEHGLDGLVDSAGTAAYHIGEAPDKRMRSTAKKFGFPIDDLRARQVTPYDFDRFDIIYAMDESNRANLLDIARNESDKGKIKLILDEIDGREHTNVPDPYYGSMADFEAVFHLLDHATDNIIQKIKP